MGWPRATAQHGGDAGIQRFLNLLGGDEMDMAVHATCRDDFALARNNLRGRTNNDGHGVLRIRVSRLANACDAPFFQSNVSFVNAGVIKDQRIGDDRIHGPFSPRRLGLPHAITDHLATTEFHFFAIERKIFFYLDDEISISQPDLVSSSGTIHLGISGAGDFSHQSSPMIFC